MAEFESFESEIVEAAMRDWGRPVVLASVESTYDPATGTVAQSVVRIVTVDAIVSRGEARATPGTAANERGHRVLVLVRRDDYGELSVSGRTVRVDNVWFDVVSIEERPGGVVALSLVERAMAVTSGAIESGVAA